jgi:murein hydrolase activator
MKQLLLITFSISFFVGHAQKKESSEFEKSKGTWPMPFSNVSKYIIEKDFNSHVIAVNTPHIIFTPSQNDSVKAVFKGDVDAVFSVGDYFAINIKYGDYLISYNNIDSPFVKKGDHITTGKYLGSLRPDNMQLELLIFNSHDHLFDPYPWFKW